MSRIRKVPASGFFLKLYLPPNALVVELVDTQDLKSCSPQREYGFDSRLGHLTFRIFREVFFLHEIPTNGRTPSTDDHLGIPYGK